MLKKYFISIMYIWSALAYAGAGELETADNAYQIIATNAIELYTTINNPNFVRVTETEVAAVKEIVTAYKTLQAFIDKDSKISLFPKSSLGYLASLSSLPKYLELAIAYVDQEKNISQAELDDAKIQLDSAKKKLATPESSTLLHNANKFEEFINTLKPASNSTNKEND